ncbi:H-NS family nucleoid-associated regulatory protein [Massilia aerilata]|uniref:H-NS family nucleoid-associated regulatory protein n=1 Tax=Massilia aerilata TaxID=453817 RepID=A0ABW0S559_9BURK
MTDLSNFSLPELRDLQTQVAEQIKTRQKDEITNVQKQILALAQGVGMTVEQIMNLKGGQPKKAAKAVAARYRHPEQPELQWTGRGRQPRWIAEYLEKSGNNLDALQIQ